MTMDTRDEATVGAPLPDRGAIAAFCRRWQVVELALFGSVLGGDFRPDSDVDVLLTIQPDAHVGLLDLLAMEYELAGMFGRPVDVVEPGAVTNPFRRRAILSQRRVLYAG
jgi:uncharacterized protein